MLKRGQRTKDGPVIIHHRPEPVMDTRAIKTGPLFAGFKAAAHAVIIHGNTLPWLAVGEEEGVHRAPGASVSQALIWIQCW
jgi:hypothetical protein